MKTNKFLLCIFFLFSYNIIIESQGLIINEFEARNRTTLADANSEYDDWIEIYNNSNSSINLNGYYITDNNTNLSKFQFTATADELTIPAGSYLILWADGDTEQGTNHLSFKLSGNGGFIGIYSPSLTPIDTISYTEQLYDVSYGRDLTNQNIWRFYKTPTAGSQNNSTYYTEIAKAPVFSLPSGVYNMPVKVSLNANGNTIFYTSNTFTPNNKSLTYKNPISLSNSAVIRTLAVNNNIIESEINSQIYLKNKHTLPILAMIIDDDYLFGTNGIYKNYDKTGSEWERFAQFKFINEDTLTKEFNAGVRIQGASSRDMEKKSFRLYFKDAYGEEKLKYPILDNKQNLEFNKLVLKAGYDDDLLETEGKGTLLRDALSVALYSQSGGMPQLSKWIVLYLDTAFWGIYNLRENIDDDFIKNHTDLDHFDLIRFASEGTELHHGTMDNWNAWFKFVTNTDFSIPENYDKLKEMTDMDEFINLMAFVHCSEYRSWAWGISMYCDKAAGSKWKFSIWDTDRAYTSSDWNGFEDIKNQAANQWANKIAAQIYRSNEFKYKLKLRIEELLNSVFIPENATYELDSLYDIIKPEIPREINRWGSKVNWENNVQAMRDFISTRPGIVRSQMEIYLNVTKIELTNNTINLAVSPNPASTKATISFNLAKVSDVSLSVYDIEGRLIQNLFSGEAMAGENSIVWDINPELKKGTYIIRMSTPGNVLHSKIILMR